ncbi:MAG: OadG family protein [Bacteroidales bacterium]|nr:OadG family protein [Bacteroidales bacterium]
MSDTILNMVIYLAALEGNALIIAVIGYLIVLLALVMLSWVFNLIPALIKIRIQPKKRNLTNHGHEEALTGEVSAAISMALYLYFNQYHDEESRNLTIKRESRLYSPWSSKIYQVRNQFNRP